MIVFLYSSSLRETGTLIVDISRLHTVVLFCLMTIMIPLASEGTLVFIFCYSSLPFYPLSYITQIITPHSSTSSNLEQVIA